MTTPSGTNFNFRNYLYPRGFVVKQSADDGHVYIEYKGSNTVRTRFLPKAINSVTIQWSDIVVNRQVVGHFDDPGERPHAEALVADLREIAGIWRMCR